MGARVYKGPPVMLKLAAGALRYAEADGAVFERFFGAGPVVKISYCMSGVLRPYSVDNPFPFLTPPFFSLSFFLLLFSFLFSYCGHIFFFM